MLGIVQNPAENNTDPTFLLNCQTKVVKLIEYHHSTSKLRDIGQFFEL